MINSKKGVKRGGESNPSGVDTRPSWILLATWIPVLLLLTGAYGVLMAVHHRFDLTQIVIHENGRNTWIGTVFYFRHFIREIPPAILMGVFVAGGFLLRAPEPVLHSSGTPHRSTLNRWLAGVLLLIVVELAGAGWMAVRQEGTHGVWLDLMQFRTRDDAEAFGSHWQFHFLHLIDSAVFCMATGLVIRALIGRVGRRFNRAGLKLVALGCGLFALLTGIFGASGQIVTSPLHLAHQFREIATHRILTLLPALGWLLWLERRWCAPLSAPGMAVDRPVLATGLVLGVVATAIPAGIAWRLRHLDVASLAQRKAGLWELYAAHNFEHVLDAILVMLIASALYLAALRFGTDSRAT